MILPAAAYQTRQIREDDTGFVILIFQHETDDPGAILYTDK